MQFSLQVSYSPYFEIKSKIAFSKEEFSSWLEKVVPATIILGAVSLGYIILSSLFRCLAEEKGIWKLWSLYVQVLDWPVNISFIQQGVALSLVEKRSRKELASSKVA
uniref:Uncharacterized protein n=1 Tax=Magallana gigas TaxID=29159 RepID=A0A8W8NP33_MAGGI